MAPTLDGHLPALGQALGAVQHLDGLGDILGRLRLQDARRLDVLDIGGIIAGQGGVVLAVGGEVENTAEAGLGEGLTLVMAGNIMSVLWSLCTNIT